MNKRLFPPSIAAVILAFAGLASSMAALANVIPAERLVPWQPGVRGGVPTVYYSVDVTDFGATADGLTDDGPAFNAAIQAAEAPGFVWVPPGDYRIATIVAMRDGIVLQGAGPAQSRLLFDLGAFGFRGGIEFTGSIEAMEIPVLSGFQFGSTEIELDSTEGMEAGTLLWLFQNDDDAAMYTTDYWRTSYSPNSMGQMVGVANVNGNAVTLDVALRLDYQASLNPRVRVVDPIEDAGIEGLYLERLDTADAYTVSMTYAQDCWLRYVESRMSYRSHLWSFYSRFLTVSDSYLHEAHDYGGGGHGYGVTLADNTSDVLVTNNIFHTLRHSMMVKEGANGNVFSYNYSFDNQQGKADGSFHGHYNYANLFEGNVLRQLIVSDWWGPSGPYTTLFRNRTTSSTGISVRDHSHYANVVGNSTGQIDVRTGADIIIFDYPVYMGGVDFELVDGNLVNGVLEWSGLPDPLELPASHYLDEPPAFWGGLPWPAIGADVDDLNEPDLQIPAQSRYPEILAGTWSPPIPEILTQTALVAGSTTTYTVINAEPDEYVILVYSFTGGGPGPCVAPLGGLCIDLLPPVRLLGTAVADANGTAQFTLPIPASAPEVDLSAQALIVRGSLSVKTNATTDTIFLPAE